MSEPPGRQPAQRLDVVQSFQQQAKRHNVPVMGMPEAEQSTEDNRPEPTDDETVMISRLTNEHLR